MAYLGLLVVVTAIMVVVIRIQRSQPEYMDRKWREEHLYRSGHLDSL